MLIKDLIQKLKGIYFVEIISKDELPENHDELDGIDAYTATKTFKINEIPDEFLDKEVDYFTFELDESFEFGQRQDAIGIVYK